MSSATLSTQREWFGHPRGITVLFLVEMWERFSYYGMRALLIFYLTQHFLFGDAVAAGIYGAYTAMLYGLAVLGGWLSDRILGGWRSIWWGAVLIMSGHLGLIAEGMLDPAAPGTKLLFFLALALIVTGTGLFKPNSTTLVGALYAKDDDRRTTGFYIFYVGINLGAALAALICGWLGQTYGWSYGFGAAAAGMALGLTILAIFRADLQPFASPPPEHFRKGFAFALPAMIVAGAWLLLQYPDFVGVVLVVALAFGLVRLGTFMLSAATPAQRKQLQAALILIGAASVFWSLFEQAGSALALFADRVVDLSIGPFTMLSSQTQFFNPAFILLLTPLFAVLWPYLRKRGIEPSITGKHILGLLQVGLGFLALIIGIRAAGSDQMVALGWLVLAYLLHTTGELCLSPPAYEAMTRLAPPQVGGLVMGLWLFSLSIGNFIAARIAALTAAPEDTGATAASLGTYSDVFGLTVGIAGVAALVLAALVPLMNRWTRVV